MNIRYEDESAVTIHRFLGTRFKHPPLSGSLSVTPSIDSQQSTSLEIVSSDTVDEKATFAVTKLSFPEGYTFHQADNLIGTSMET